MNKLLSAFSIYAVSVVLPLGCLAKPKFDPLAWNWPVDNPVFIFFPILKENGKFRESLWRVMSSEKKYKMKFFSLSFDL